MQEIRLGAVESRFADLIWQNEPLSSAELVRLAAEALSWKKSSTFTVLKRLCQRGLFENRQGTVHALLSRQEFDALQSRQFVEDAFDGSLPAFLAAFTRRGRLSEEDIRQLQDLIDRCRKGEQT